MLLNQLESFITKYHGEVSDYAYIGYIWKKLSILWCWHAYLPSVLLSSFLHCTVTTIVSWWFHLYWVASKSTVCSYTVLQATMLWWAPIILIWLILSSCQIINSSNFFDSLLLLVRNFSIKKALKRKNSCSGWMK